jgi:hypothetical protein
MRRNIIESFLKSLLRLRVQPGIGLYGPAGGKTYIHIDGGILYSEKETVTFGCGVRLPISLWSHMPRDVYYCKLQSKSKKTVAAIFQEAEYSVRDKLRRRHGRTRTSHDVLRGLFKKRDRNLWTRDSGARVRDRDVGNAIRDLAPRRPPKRGLVDRGAETERGHARDKVIVSKLTLVNGQQQHARRSCRRDS